MFVFCSDLPWPAVWTGFFPIHHTAGVGPVAGHATPSHLTQWGTKQDKKFKVIHKRLWFSQDRQLTLHYLGIVNCFLWTYQSWQPAEIQLPVSSLAFPKELNYLAGLFVGTVPGRTRQILGVLFPSPGGRNSVPPKRMTQVQHKMVCKLSHP